MCAESGYNELGVEMAHLEFCFSSKLEHNLNYYLCDSLLGGLINYITCAIIKSGYHR